MLGMNKHFGHVGNYLKQKSASSSLFAQLGPTKAMNQDVMIGDW